MEKIELILKKIGLTDTETKIYLVGLSYNSIGVSELEKETRIKRTTIYHAINTLIQKGLASKKDIGKKQVFSMTRPENLKRFLEREIKFLEEQKKEIDEIIPLFPDSAKKSDSCRVSHFEGLEGIKLVVEEALYCHDRKWMILAPEKNFFSEFDSIYAKYYLKTRKENGIVCQSLWEYNSGRKIPTPEELAERNPRYLPPFLKGRFKSVIIIFDDKVAIISSLKSLSAILIKSEEIKITVAAMFESLWTASEEIGEIIGKE